MSRAAKLVHPATLFIQHLAVTEVAFKDMNPMQQTAIFDFMEFEGAGSWAEHVTNLEEAIKLYGDVRFNVGKFANDDTLKTTFAAYTPDEAEGAVLDEWFKNRYVCERNPVPLPPVIMESATIAAEFSLFEWGHEWFYSYWAHLPETEFVAFLPSWDANDDSGRGGQ